MKKEIVITDTNIVVLLCCSKIEKYFFTSNEYVFLYVTKRVVEELENWIENSPVKQEKFKEDDMLDHIVSVAKREEYDPHIENVRDLEEIMNEILSIKDRMIKSNLIKGCSDVDLSLLSSSIYKNCKLATQEHDLTSVATWSKLDNKDIITFEDLAILGHDTGLVCDQDFLNIKQNLKKYDENLKKDKIEKFNEREEKIKSELKGRL